MGDSDKAQKMLLDHNDEFAEVFSVFALKNKIHLLSKIKNKPLHLLPIILAVMDGV